MKSPPELTLRGPVLPGRATDNAADMPPALLGIFRDGHRRPRLHRAGSVAQARPSGLHARDIFSPNLSRSGSIKSSARITKRWTRPANALRTRQATGLANMRTYTDISA